MIEYTETEKKLILSIAKLAVDAYLKRSPFDALPYPSGLDDYLRSSYVQSLPEPVRQDVLDAAVEQKKAAVSAFILSPSTRGQNLLRSVEREMMHESQGRFVPTTVVPYGADSRAVGQCITDQMKNAFPDFVKERKGHWVSVFAGAALVFSKTVNDRKLYLILDRGRKVKGQIQISVALDYPSYTVSLKQLFGLPATVRFGNVEQCASELKRVTPFLKVLVPRIISIVGAVPPDPLAK